MDQLIENRNNREHRLAESATESIRFDIYREGYRELRSGFGSMRVRIGTIHG